jgi:hypothetical protein
MAMFGASRRLSQLEEDFRGVQRKVADMELQWLDTQHRLRSMLGRIVKSAALLADRDGDGEKTRDVAPGSASSTAAGQWLDPISARILQRRQRQFPNLSSPDDSKEGGG